MSSRSALALVAALVALSGCFPGLTLTAQEATTHKPSNVVVYMTVETNDGKPVENLSAGQFTIFEDGVRVPRAVARQTLLKTTATVARYTLLLVDLSGTALGTKEAGDIIKAASKLAEQPQRSEAIAVYTFDGSPGLNAVVPFTLSTDGGGAASDSSVAFKPKDPSTNVNGAVVEGLRILRTALAADMRPLKLGTLVVFTAGADRATPGGLRLAYAAPENARMEMFSVGVGASANAQRLDEIGRNGTITETDPADVTKGLDAVMDKVHQSFGKYYLVSYCTPARAGLHEVRIEAHSRDDLLGDVTYRFHADGFTAGCDPTNPPGFEVTPPPSVAPVETKKEPPPRKATPKPAPHEAPSRSAEPSSPAPDPFAP
jgi:hypothetical protein